MMPRVRGAGHDTSFLFLSQEDVVAAGGTDMPAIVEVIERAFRIKAAGGVFMPPKVMITWSDEPGTEELHGRIMAMPAYVGGEVDVAGLKRIPSVPDNPSRRGLPRANALVLLSDRETGLPLAVMDGTVVSAMRTGAVTGVAVRHLASPADEVACLLGAGVLAHTQLDALRAVMPSLREARVHDPAKERLQRFCERQSAADRPGCAPGGRPERAIRGAQVVVPATMAVAPTSSRSGSTRARRWCWCPAWTRPSRCTRSPTCWWSTTGCTNRRTRAATPGGWLRRASCRRRQGPQSSWPT